MKKAVTSAGGLVAVTCLPREAYAGCSSQTRGFRFSAFPDQHTVQIPDLKLGDCELKDASLTNLPGGHVVVFNAQVCTYFTHTRDVWHIQLKIFQSGQGTLLNQSFSGPQMSEQDKPFFHSWTARFPLHPTANGPRGLAATITSCC
jgi:hypothetical protein